MKKTNEYALKGQLELKLNHPSEAEQVRDSLAQWEAVASKHDSSAFYRFAQSKGYYTLDDLRQAPQLLAFEKLFTQGLVQMNGHVDYDRNVATYRRLTHVALTRFPELNKGESIAVREIKDRLRIIRNAGYEVKPYSRMDKEEAWAYLMGIRKDIREKAKELCPDALREVDSLNTRRKSDGRSHL